LTTFERDLVRARYAGPLVLASSSARRRELMTEAGYDFRVIVPKLAEDHLHRMPAQVLAESLAYAKARQVADGLEHDVVIGADTVVVLDNEVIGKARDADEARATLGRLAGTTHEVITGLCVLNARRGERLIGAEITRITMRPMSDDELAEYVHSGEGIGKAGGYAIQETGDRFVADIDGSFTNVVGLPMKLLADYLDVMAKLIYRD
jgi:septum formation protein